jgi:hypothetical protein
VSWRRVAAAVLVVLACTFGAQEAHARPAGADPGTSTPAPRAPTGPPLTSGSTGAESHEAEASASAPSSEGDPLVENGLGSPLCREGASAELSRASTRNCLTSGFEATQAPTSNYAFDVHINTGVLGANGDTLEQDYVISPVWMALVWITHALIVALEWCFTIDLLNGKAMGDVAQGLRTAQATFTQPWLVLALAVASVLALYHGLIRRRVAETLGQALLMGAMMLGGLWVIANPTGTLGALGQLANQASLGTLGAVTDGTPAHPDRTLANSMQGIFSDVVGAPWCYMEFGDVGWCTNPARLDPRLHAAGLKIASGELAKVGCKSSGASLPPSEVRELGLSPSEERELGLSMCVSAGSAQGKALSQSAELLRNAHTNGELFLALPANQTARNSINESGSLFNVLCGGSHEPCKGPTAAQAEFRTPRGTQSRLGGLFLIAIGALGMALLLGFIALHLLSAAIISLFYLLLAPAAVIAPALGDGGRAAFRGWAKRLLSAVTAKLLYSFMLGVVLLMERILMSLPGFGWWTQWLLLAVLWWGAFRHRHDVLGLAPGIRPREHSEHGVGGLRLASRLMAARELGRAGKWAHRRLSSGPPSAEKRQRVAAAGSRKAEAIADRQAGTSLERSYYDAQEQLQEEPQMRARQAERREKLKDLTTTQSSARARGHQGRADRVGRAARRVEKEIQLEERKHQLARHTVTEGDRAKGQSGRLYTAAQAKERGQFLDAQATLPRRQRDYASLAGVIGHSPDEWKRLSPPARDKAREASDRELATRGQLAGAVEDVVKGKEPSLGPIRRRRVEQRFDTALEKRVGAEGHSRHPSQETPVEIWQRTGRSAPTPRARESSVMRDAREVAARRKRQLDREREK